jgi:hypothetical protein
MKKVFYLIFFLPLFSFVQTNAGYYINTITYDTTNHSCCVEFIDSSSSIFPLVSWVWYFGDSTAPCTAPNCMHCFTDTGVFEVCLIVTDSNGVKDTSCCNFNFLDLDSAFLDCDSLTGIFAPTAEDFQFSPNPANDFMNITFALNKSARVGIALYDLTGRMMKMISEDRKISGMHKELIDLRGISNGIYLLQVTVDDVPITSKRIIINTAY